MLLFVENLNLLQLLLLSASALRGGPSVAVRFLVIDRAGWGVQGLARLLQVLGLPVRVEVLEFDFVSDVLLPDGRRAIDEIYYSGGPAVFTRMEGDPLYELAVRRGALKQEHIPWIRAYLAKRIFSETYRGFRNVHVASWYCRTRIPEAGSGVALVQASGYAFEFLATYAADWGIPMKPMPIGHSLAKRLFRRIRSWAKGALGIFQRARSGRRPSPGRSVQSARVAVEMYMNGSGGDPLYNSDLFWFKPFLFPRGTLLAYFAHSHDQPTPERSVRLKADGIEPVGRQALRALMNASLWRRTRASSSYGPYAKPPGAASVRRSQLALYRTLREYIAEFYLLFDQWLSFFSATGTRIHVSSSDVFPESEVLHAALAEAGGISVSIQRSIELEPYLFRRTVVDVHFAFCRNQVQREAQSGSSVRQMVVCGYPFDCAFEAARKQGQQLRATLSSRGVRFAVAFFDENDGIQPKRFGGKAQVQGDYRFLCERLETDPSLGLFLKPKRPETLPDRLGSVWPRLRCLIDSGRCIYLGGDSIDRRYLPCVAACAADAAINLAGGATAGLESFLAGTRTLLLRHRVDAGIFGRLPEGTVVFDDWWDLWAAVERLRRDPQDPDIGHWGPILEECASFRDGRSAERIAAYLGWLFEILRSGRGRERALQGAARRYEVAWGQGLVSEVRPDVRAPLAAWKNRPSADARERASLVGQVR